MLIELMRKLVATDYSITPCVICGNDFDLGSVYAQATGDRGEQMGELCPTCLDYLNRRKEDAEDPTLDNWPARGWPTVEVLERLRRRHPEPMFETYDELLAAATDRAADDRIHEATMVWRMERENEMA
jgi:hypothetical protein